MFRRINDKNETFRTRPRSNQQPLLRCRPRDGDVRCDGVTLFPHPPRNRRWNVTVVVNGQPREFAGPLTVAELLGKLELPGRGVAVEVNLQIVPRSRHAEHQLADGDQLEIVTLVGGG
jgi:sulfur carrier protein